MNPLARNQPFRHKSKNATKQHILIHVHQLEQSPKPDCPQRASHDRMKLFSTASPPKHTRNQKNASPSQCFSHENKKNQATPNLAGINPCPRQTTLNYLRLNHLTHTDLHIFQNYDGSPSATTKPRSPEKPNCDEVRVFL